MPKIVLEWLDKPRNILRADYPKGWTWEDYHGALDRVIDLLDDRDNPVAFVNVYEAGASLPHSSPSSHWKRSARTFAVRYVMYVTRDPVLKTILRQFLNTINYVEGHQYDFVDSVEDALAFLNKRPLKN